VKLLCRFFIWLAGVDQMKIGGKTLSDSLCFGKNLLKARRKRRRYGNGFVRRWIAHRSERQLRVS